MRFSVVHKVTTYAMVLFAYFGMTGGGGVAPAVTLAGFVAILLSWWAEPPRVRLDRPAWTRTWTGLTLLVFIYSLLTALATGDFLGVGGQFLVMLVVAKSMTRRAPKDWQQLYLLAFLMLVAGSVLNPELTYGVCFLGFVITTTWALTLFHLRREIEDNLLVKHATDTRSERVEVKRILDSKRIIGARFLGGTAMLSFGAFLVAAVIFLALPRVGFGFFIKGKSGLTLAGFSDGVQLGGHGVIKDDPTVVMRVEIAAKYGGLAAPEIHWRGVAFDHYERGRWTRTMTAPNTRGYLEETPIKDRRMLSWAGPPISTAQQAELIETAVKQDIWLDPLDSDVLFGASNPRILEYPHSVRRHKPYERNDEMRLEHGATLHYTVYSELDPPPTAELQASSGPLPKGYDVYTQLPSEITQRTRDLAAEITAGSTTTLDKAVAIQRYLQANMTYTRELADPGKREPVEFFLFDRKRGHCEYFASAFAVLARATVPPIAVRDVNGFMGGEWNEYQSYVAVRAGDAHSWDEVFFPGVRGAGVWVTFDPTPPSEALGRGGSGWRERLGRYLDTLRFQWNKWVIEYDLMSQLDLFRSIGRALQTAARWVKVRAKQLLPIGIGIAVVIAGVVWWRRRKRGARAEDDVAGARALRRRRSQIGEVYTAVRKRLERAGLAPSRIETPREVAARMTTAGRHGAAAVSELTELYYAAEWGGRSDPAAEARARVLAVTIRDELRRKTA